MRNDFHEWLSDFELWLPKTFSQACQQTREEGATRLAPNGELKVCIDNAALPEVWGLSQTWPGLTRPIVWLKSVDHSAPKARLFRA